jgi:hypothetical protein
VPDTPNSVRSARSGKGIVGTPIASQGEGKVTLVRRDDLYKDRIGYSAFERLVVRPLKRLSSTNHAPLVVGQGNPTGTVRFQKLGGGNPNRA